MMKHALLFAVSLLYTTVFADEWSLQTVSLTGASGDVIIADISFPAATDGYLLAWKVSDWAASWYVARTADAGRTWSVQYTVAEDSISGFSSLQMFEGGRGWMVLGDTTEMYGESKSMLLRTSDGGETWNGLTSLAGYWSVDDIYFLSDDIGWGVFSTEIAEYETEERLVDGEWVEVQQLISWEVRDTLMRTIDGGATWSSMQSITETSWNAYDVLMAFSDSLNGWAYGIDDMSEGSFYHTDDGGRSWTMQSPGLSSDELVYDIVCLDEQTVLFCTGSGKILKTVDGGGSWSVVFEVGGTAYGNALRDLAFADALNGYVCGANGRIRKTSDGGQSWEDSKNGYSNYYAVAYPDVDNAWVCGEAGLEVRTSSNVLVSTGLHLSSGAFVVRQVASQLHIDAGGAEQISAELYTLGGRCLVRARGHAKIVLALPELAGSRLVLSARNDNNQSLTRTILR